MMIFFGVPLVIGLILLGLQIAAGWDRRGKVMRVITLDDGRTRTVWVPATEPASVTFARVKAELDWEAGIGPDPYAPRTTSVPVFIPPNPPAPPQQAPPNPWIAKG